MENKSRVSIPLLISLLLVVWNTPSATQSLTEFPESGRFKLFKNESQIGTIEYTLDAEGNYHRVFALTLAGQEAQFVLKIIPDSAGHWKSAEIFTPTDSVVVHNQDSVAAYSVKAKKYQTPLSDYYILDDNYGPVFETFVLKQYDMARGGKQIFPRFLIPSKILDIELEYMGQEIRAIGPDDWTFLRFDLTLLGIKVEIWADAENKIYMLNVPIQYAAFVREGFEDLMAYRNEDPLLSKPEFAVKKESLFINMRDGVGLATDLYMPQGKPGPFPVVLIRTPYKKEMSELDGQFFGSRGYVVAIQDCRGRFSSEGTWDPFFNETEDGYDTIEWLGTRPWSNGKVGMIGGSYVGWVQLWAAAARPPHLKTIIPNVAPPDPFYNIPYEYGAFFILGSFWWAEVLESEATGDLSGRAMGRINERKYEQLLKSLPVIELDKKVLGKENRYWREWIQHNTNDSYWQRANFMTDLANLEIPVFLQSGWFDGDGIGTKLNYMALRKGPEKPIKMIVGPWGHTTESSSRLGDYDFGQEAALDLRNRYLKWFDYWLKDIQNDILDEPLVRLFAMFSNEWHSADTYPLPQTQFTKFYLHSGGSANTSKGDGRLVRNQSTEAAAYDEYVYDPGDPTPSPEYYYKSEEEVKQEEQNTIELEKQKQKVKAFHNAVTDSRRDILVYQTEPLTEPVTIVGPVSAVLSASTSAVDTDWFVTLMDVDEKGEIFHLTKGVLRARFRHSTEKPQLLEPNKIYEFTIDMWHTGITFQAGHRIRIEVSSALFPLFSRNLNTGGHNEIETTFIEATQRIYHTQEHPSYVVLPLINSDPMSKMSQQK